VKPCLSVIQEQPKSDGGGGKDTPDMRDTHVGPCLSPPPPDRSQPDLQPCLQPPPPDRRSEPPPDRAEPDLQPCLSRPPPDRRDEPAPDKAKEPPPERDAGVGPCLSPPPPDQGTKEGGQDKMGMNDMGRAPADRAGSTRMASRASERSDAIERLQARGVLPADVAARLQSSKSKKKA